MEDENSILFVLDEVGFGTKRLRNYGYSKIGEPVIFKWYIQVSFFYEESLSKIWRPSVFVFPMVKRRVREAWTATCEKCEKL